MALDTCTTITEGGVVALFFSRDNIAIVKAERGAAHDGKFGKFALDDLIGVEYGNRVYSRDKRNGRRGFAFALRVTPELWTRGLRHRTQVVYSRDISYITYMLELRNGSIVCEAGTGSGSLSFALVRAVAPSGHLHTYEFHQQRAELARADFDRLGVASNVTVRHADVTEAAGFAGVDSGRADAVFLDLPAPWLAIEAAKRVLRPSVGRICCFSPCVEQVQRTARALREHRFVELVTVECLLKPLEVYRSASFAMPYRPRTRDECSAAKRARLDADHTGATGDAAAAARNDSKLAAEPAHASGVDRARVQASEDKKPTVVDEVEMECAETADAPLDDEALVDDDDDAGGGGGGRGRGGDNDNDNNVDDDRRGGGDDTHAHVSSTSARSAQPSAATACAADALATRPSSSSSVSVAAVAVADRDCGPSGAATHLDTSSGAALVRPLSTTACRQTRDIRGHTSYLTFAVRGEEPL